MNNKTPKPKLLVKIIQSPIKTYWYSILIGDTFEVYLERDCYLFIDDYDEQRYCVAEDVDANRGARSLLQSDCVILKILPLNPAPTNEVLSILNELKSDLWYQIESKHGPEKASMYPSIVKYEEFMASR